MISERSFASGFSSFWRGTLPNLESVVRALNQGWERVDLPITSLNEPYRRDVISETGFQLFGAWLAQSELPPDSIAHAFDKAVSHLRRLPVRGRRSLDPLTRGEIEEVTLVARRLKSFCSARIDSASLAVEPKFPGHGMISQCQGDICDSENILEIKYVDRHYRSIDYKQCLIYASLKYFQERETFSNIMLYNPFLGVSTKIGLEELVDGASGNTFVDFAGDLSYILTSGELSR